MTLSMVGYLWQNSVTDIHQQEAYNNGILHLTDWGNAHASNTTVNGVAPDKHNTSHITASHTSFNIAQVSSDVDTTLDVLVAEIMTRVHQIEGDGAATWGAGSAPSNLANLLATANGLQGGTVLAGKAALANALTAPTALTGTISDYKVTPSTTAGVVNVAAGSPYVDSAANYIAAGVATTVTLPSQPTLGNSQYVWITKPTATGTPHASTTGVPSGSPAIPAYPTGEEPLALILYRGATANPTNVLVAGDITDIRYGHGGTGGGAGGGTSVPATPEVVIGASGSAFQLDLLLSGGDLANSTPYNGIVPANIRVSEKIVADGPTSATLEDYLSVAVSGDILGALQAGATLGTLALRVPVGKPPITAKIGGKRQRADSTATITSNAAGAAGLYILAADLNGTGPLFTLALVASLSANQVGLVQAYWDGSVFYFAAPHGPRELTKPIVNGVNFQPLHQSVIYAQTATLAIAGSVTQLPSTTPLTFYIPEQGMTAYIRWRGNAVAPATPGDFRIYAMSSNGVGAALAQITSGFAWLNIQPANSTLPASGYFKMTNLNSGAVNFGLGYFASVANYVIVEPTIEVEITR